MDARLWLLQARGAQRASLCAPQRFIVESCDLRWRDSGGGSSAGAPDAFATIVVLLRKGSSALKFPKRSSMPTRAAIAVRGRRIEK